MSEINLVPCAHPYQDSIFTRKVWASGFGFHIQQQCCACGQVLPGWVKHYHFVDPASLPSSEDNNVLPNGCLYIPDKS